MERSRLGQILETERRSGKGTLGALVSALGGRTLESLDPRGRLFGRAGTRSNTFAQSLGRSVFGAGYSATRGSRYPAERIYGDSAGLGGGANAAILSSMDSRLASIDAKMSLVAKAGIAQNRVARDINVMRQNIQVQTKSMTGTSRTKADMYFMNVKQRESEYEKQFRRETRPTESATSTTEGTSPKSSLMGMLGKGMGMLGTGLKAGAGIGAIYLGIQALSGLVNAFSFFSSLADPIIKKVMDFVDVAKSWKEKWEKFDLNEYLKSISPDQLGTILDSITNFIKNTSGGIGDTIRGVIEKLPADKVGTLIDAVVDSFLKTVQTLGSKLVDAVSTMDSGNIIKLAAAGGIYSILFGGGGKAVGGVIGGLLRGVIPLLIKNPIAVAAILAALGIAKATSNILSLGEDNTPEPNIRPENYQGDIREQVANRHGTTAAELERSIAAMPEDTPENKKLKQNRIDAYRMLWLGAGEEWKAKAEETLFPTHTPYAPTNKSKGFARRNKSGRIDKNIRPMSEASIDMSPMKFTPTREDLNWDLYSKNISSRESGGVLGIIGGSGNLYLGKYQLGSSALETVGLLKKGSSKGNAAAWKDPNNWTEGNSLEQFLASPEIQDKAFRDYTMSNYSTLAKNGVITNSTSIGDKMSLLAASHLVGATAVSNANQLALDTNKSVFDILKTNKDANGTSAASYAGMFNNLGFEHPSLSDRVTNALGDAASTAGEAARAGLAIFQNFYADVEKKSEEAENAILGSFDSNTIKDIMNPLLMRTTMSYL